MEDEISEELLNEGECTHEQEKFDEILVVPPIQSPPRSDYIGTVSMKCHLCDYFANKHCNLIYHMSTHGRNLEFKCELCNFSSAKKFALTNHTKNQHHLQLLANYDKNEEISNDNDLELRFNDEDSESDSYSLTYGLGPMKKVPLAKKLIFNSRKTEKICPIRKQHHRSPFFFSLKRERKWRFCPPGLRRLPFPCQKKKLLNCILKKNLKALRLKKPNVPFQSLTRIVERPKTTRLDQSHSPPAEKNLRSRIHAGDVAYAHQKGLKWKKNGMVYKCPECNYTVGRFVCNAHRIEQHELNHQGKGRHKCNQCSFSHNSLNILKCHSRFDHHQSEKMEEVGIDKVSIEDNPISTNDCNEKDVGTVPPANQSLSLREENLQNRIQSGTPSVTVGSDCQNGESKGTKKKFYECHLCNCTFNQSKLTADKIKHHEKAHKGNGRNKCDKCSFSHDRLNILKFHLKYHHRGKIEPKKEESLQVPLNDPGLPEFDEMENGGTDSPTLEFEETVYFQELEIGSPDLMGEPILNNYLGSPGPLPDLGSSESPPDLGEPICYDRIEKTLDCEIDCPDSPPVLEVPDTAEEVRDVFVKISPTPVGFGFQSRERNAMAIDECLEYDLRLASETLKGRVLSEEDRKVEQQTFPISSHNGSLQDVSFLLESDAFNSLMEMGDGLVDQVLSSDNNLLEEGLWKVMPESTQKTEPPNWIASEPRITAADEWMKQFKLFYEEVKDLKKKDLDEYHSRDLRAKLVRAQTECKMLFKELNAEVELERTAAIRLQNELEQQQPTLQQKRDHPDISKARSKVDTAKEAVRATELCLIRLRKEEDVLHQKIQALRDAKSGLQGVLHRKLKMYNEFLESHVFKTEDVLAEMTKWRKTIESIKAIMEKVEKNLQSLLTEERIVSECRQRADDDLIDAYEQQCVNQIKLNDLDTDRKSHEEKVKRLPFSSEKMEVCKNLDSCLLKIVQKLCS